jgi:hypothetical protein
MSVKRMTLQRSASILGLVQNSSRGEIRGLVQLPSVPTLAWYQARGAFISQNVVRSSNGAPRFLPCRALMVKTSRT